MKKKTSKFAIASLVICLAAPFCFIGSLVLASGVLFFVSLCFPVLAIVFGIGALYYIRTSEGELAGNGRAWAGLIGGLLIIAAIFMPLIGGGLTSSSMLRIGNNGKNIVLAIISANSEREAMGLTNVWPSISSDFSGMRKDYTKVQDSETYFTDLLDSGAVVNLSWYVFSGAGVMPATNRASFNQGNHNIWNVVAGLDKNAPDDTPFLFTRNLNITVDDLRDDTVNLQSKLDRKIKPFGKEEVVFILKGGAMQRVSRKYMTNRQLFLGSSVFDDVNNRNATVLKAKGMPD